MSCLTNTKCRVKMSKKNIFCFNRYLSKAYYKSKRKKIKFMKCTKDTNSDPRCGCVFLAILLCRWSMEPVPVMYHVSCVTCHMACITCHM